MHVVQDMHFVGLKVTLTPVVRMLYNGFFVAGTTVVFCAVSGRPYSHGFLVIWKSCSQGLRKRRDLAESPAWS